MPVFLLYVDESGRHDAAGEPFIVGGLAIHEGDLVAFRKMVHRTVSAHLAPHLTGLELHAQHMLSGKGPWRGIPKQTREELVVDLAGKIGRFGRAKGRSPFALFSVVKEAGAIKGANTLERTFEELLLRFNEMLVRINPDGPAPRGMIVADNARYESTLQPIVTRWREEGTRFKRLHRVVEVPLFCDSKATPLIQAADFVAHGVYRQYVRGDGRLFDQLLPAFDEEQHVVHGLVHLTPNHKRCSCIACASRARARAL